MTERRIAGVPEGSHLLLRASGRAIRPLVARVVGAACLLVLLAAAPAAAEEVIVDDPTIVGAPENVTTFTGVGWEDDLLRAYAQGDGNAEVDGAQWDASLSGGTYRVDAWVPREHAGAVVKYTIGYNGGEKEVRLGQPDFSDAWVTLGTFNIDGPQASVRSTDAGGTAGSEIAWDAIRWTRVDPAPSPDPSSNPQIVDDPTILGPAGLVNTFVGIGWDGDLLSTHAQGEGGTEYNAAEWDAALEGGSYQVDAWIPRGHADTVVNYTVRHRGGETVVPVDQSSYKAAWVPLGTFDVDGPQGSVRATDAGGTPGSEIAWDAIRWTRIDSPAPPGDTPPGDTSPGPTPANPASLAPPGGDRDGDSLPDALDRCPLQPRGALDSNGDGCPGPIRFVARQLRSHRMLAATQLLTRRNGPVVAFRIENISIGRPKGTSVELRCSPCLLRRGGSGHSHKAKHSVVRKTGSMSVRRLLKAQLRSGSMVEVLVTHPSWIGRYYSFEFGRTTFTRRDACLVPGSNRPRPCKTV
jgi:hypothetical protein